MKALTRFLGRSPKVVESNWSSIEFELELTVEPGEDRFYARVMPLGVSVFADTEIGAVRAAVESTQLLIEVLVEDNDLVDVFDRKNVKYKLTEVIASSTAICPAVEIEAQASWLSANRAPMHGSALQLA